MERAAAAQVVMPGPETERQSHYFHARIADQFDYVVHVDETRAVEPLETASESGEGELPETYPFGVSVASRGVADSVASQCTSRRSP